MHLIIVILKIFPVRFIALQHVFTCLELKTIDLVNHPANLVLLDISSYVSIDAHRDDPHRPLFLMLRNEFQTLPDWFDEENPALERLIANHNRINVLPAR